MTVGSPIFIVSNMLMESLGQGEFRVGELKRFGDVFYKDVLVDTVEEELGLAVFSINQIDGNRVAKCFFEGEKVGLVVCALCSK